MSPRHIFIGLLYFLFWMNIIGSQGSVSKRGSDQGFYFRIAQALAELRCEAQLCTSEEGCRFTMALRQKKRVQAKLYTLWIFKKDIQLEVKVELIDQHHTLTPPDSLVPVKELVNQLNRDSFLGTYFTNPNKPHLLCCRHLIPLDAQAKFFSQDIAELYSELSEQFTKFVCNLNLIPNPPEIKSDKLQTRLVILRHLREQFEMKRFMREKATKHYDLSSSSIKVVDQAVKVIGYQTRLIQYFKSGDAVMNATKQKHCEQIYRTVRDRIQKQSEQQREREKPQEIVKGIQILEVIQEKVLGKGGFSIIYKGQYYAAFYPTINPQLLPKGQFAIEPKGKQLLVKKTASAGSLNEISFNNELAFLKHIRSERHNRFSGYYLPKSNSYSSQPQLQRKHIFLNYYQQNLYTAVKSMGTEQKFRACRQIIEAIAFLASRNILHRDLKETNILVDNAGNIKLIDFGSSCGIYAEKPVQGNYQAFSNDLMSTEDYFLPYRQVINQLPLVAKTYSRDQYNRAETFDSYSFGTIVRNLFNLTSVCTSLVVRELSYLASKCRQKNPADRFIASEAQSYLYQICELFKVSSKLEEQGADQGRSSSKESFE